NVTSKLLATDPNNPERVFDQAQSVYWAGFDEYVSGHYAAVRKAFEEYRILAKRMISLNPREPRYLRELAYAEGNLCTLALRPPKQAAKAVALCSDALRHLEQSAAAERPSIWVKADLANRHAWLADAYHADGNDQRAREERLIDERMLTGLMAAD